MPPEGDAPPDETRRPPRPTQDMVPAELAPDPPSDLRGRVVLITAGANNLGRGAALAFARAGARVMVADIDAIGARRTVADMQHRTDDCDWVRANLLEEGEIEHVVARTVDRFGRIDVLVNNFGLDPAPDLPEEVDAEGFDEEVRANVRQHFLTCRGVLPIMRRQGGGSIVGTSSICGVIACRQAPLYSITKAGIANLMRSVASRYATHGIRANTVCPGHVLTESRYDDYTDWRLHEAYPCQRIGRIRDIVEAYLYLASERSSFVTGEVLMVDGGFTIH